VEEVAVCKWGVGDVNLDLHQTQDEADEEKRKVNRKKNEINNQRLRCLNRRLTLSTFHSATSTTYCLHQSALIQIYLIVHNLKMDNLMIQILIQKHKILTIKHLA
jgi:hypothetical protein